MTRPVPWLAVSLLAVGVSVSEASADSSAERDFAQRIAACTSCHGEQGEGGDARFPYYPRLAGQSAPYLYRQLRAFQTGERDYALMNRIVSDLPDDYLREIAQYFARQTPPKLDLPVNSDAAQLELGRKLVQESPQSADGTACIECHGATLAGDSREHAPAIAGQHQSYLSAALQDWKAGKRPDLGASGMAAIAASMSDQEIHAAAAYLASLPVTARPDEALPLPKPDTREAVDSNAQGIATEQSGLYYPMPDTASEQVRRGRYLAIVGDCAGCHTQDVDQPFAGGVRLDSPFGPMFGPNITPHPEHGIGGWTAEEFREAMLDGVAPGHKYLYPAFPFTSYALVKPEDVDAIKAWLDTLEPLDVPSREHDLQWPFSMRPLMLGWRLLFFWPDPFEDSSTHSDTWNRGAYLVKGLGHCEACHSPRNLLGAEKNDEALGGGVVEQWRAPNISSNPDYGIGSWSIEALQTFLKTGQAPDHTIAAGPMREVIHRSLQFLTDEDLHAIAYYLKNAEAQNESVSPATAKAGPNAPSDPEAGLGAYAEHCASCHGRDGRGKAPGYPPLAGNPTVTDTDPTNVLRVILEGGFAAATDDEPHPHSMPPFGPSMSDEQIAAVASYVRSNWGNRASPASPQQVNRLR